MSDTENDTPKGPQATDAPEGIHRRDVMKSFLAGAVSGVLASPTAAEAQILPEAQAAVVQMGTNPYGAPAGTGITMPPYYRPTASVRNRNSFFPGGEVLGDDEMRITFMGSNPFPPRLSQAGTCIMVECGQVGRFFFDFGSGAMRNIIGNQVPVPEITDIFLTHLHVDHFADLAYNYAFGPNLMRWKPLRVYGPSGRTPDLGTAAMIDNMKKMCAWHIQSFTASPAGDGYDVEVTEFDFRDDGGICYDKDGVTVRHWRRSHTMDGASAYRLDWNGLSFVWTGDGKADELTAKYAKGCDVFVTEMAVDNPALWAMRQGLPMELGAFTIDASHTAHYGVGYLTNQINPRLGMATHFSYDRDVLAEAIAGVNLHWKGMFALGMDHTVVNVTKDALWIREAAVPDTASNASVNPQWMVKEMFGGKVPESITLPTPKHTIADVQEQSVRDLEINPDVFTPPDQVRPWVREFPAGLKIDPAAMGGGGKPPPKP